MASCEIKLRPDDRTPNARMRSALHHVRCEECDACQEYMVDAPAGPFCDHARALVRLDKGHMLGERARHGLYRVGWAEHWGYSEMTESGRAALERALDAAKSCRSWAPRGAGGSGTTGDVAIDGGDMTC